MAELLQDLKNESFSYVDIVVIGKDNMDNIIKSFQVEIVYASEEVFNFKLCGN